MNDEIIRFDESGKTQKHLNCKHYEIVIYKDYLKVDLQETLKSYSTIKYWAYILHDKDDTAAHYHVYINFDGASVSSELVAKWFNLSYVDKDGKEHNGEQFIERVKGRRADMLLYLTHGNDSQRHKHQYSPDEVVANFDFKTEIKSAQIIGYFENYSYAQQLAYIHSLPKTEQKSYYNQLQNLWRVHCEWLTLNTDRDLKVIFVCGAPGTGKTFYAKKLIQSMGYDFCISSSANDPLQDYMGQDALLLDDVRDESFEKYEELLKLLDNDTGSSFKSRYNNKIFNGKLIVITSPVPLSNWFPEKKYNLNDTLKQLFRRISAYVNVLDDVVKVYNKISVDGRPIGKYKVYYNEVQKLKKGKERKTFDLISAFDKIAEVKESVDSYSTMTLSEVKDDEILF